MRTLPPRKIAKEEKDRNESKRKPTKSYYPDVNRAKHLFLSFFASKNFMFELKPWDNNGSG